MTEYKSNKRVGGEKHLKKVFPDPMKGFKETRKFMICAITRWIPSPFLWPADTSSLSHSIHWL